MIDTIKDKPRKVFTLVFIIDGDQVLLGYKKRGFGQGKWNGFGGKLMEGETIVDAAVREVKEECNLDLLPEDLHQFAILYFEFVDQPVIMEVHTFKCEKFEGNVEESDEMRPKWYPLNETPKEQMWADDPIWYPLFLEGKRFLAYFNFEGYTKILKYSIVDFDDSTKVILEKQNVSA